MSPLASSRDKDLATVVWFTHFFQNPHIGIVTLSASCDITLCLAAARTSVIGFGMKLYTWVIISSHSLTQRGRLSGSSTPLKADSLLRKNWWHLMWWIKWKMNGKMSVFIQITEGNFGLFLIFHRLKKQPRSWRCLTSCPPPLWCVEPHMLKFAV